MLTFCACASWSFVFHMSMHLCVNNSAVSQAQSQVWSASSPDSVCSGSSVSAVFKARTRTALTVLAGLSSCKNVPQVAATISPRDSHQSWGKIIITSYCLQLAQDCWYCRTQGMSRLACLCQLAPQSGMQTCLTSPNTPSTLLPRP